MARTRDQLATSGSVDEFDYYRRMIRGLWAFSSLSVAVGGAKTLHDRRACEREIDTHSPSSMECAISIVPPRERTDPIRVRVTHCVHKAPLLHLTNCAMSHTSRSSGATLKSPRMTTSSSGFAT